MNLITFGFLFPFSSISPTIILSIKFLKQSSLNSSSLGVVFITSSILFNLLICLSLLIIKRLLIVFHLSILILLTNIIKLEFINYESEKIYDNKRKKRISYKW